jgi:hypothetical protein
VSLPWSQISPHRHSCTTRPANPANAATPLVPLSVLPVNPGPPPGMIRALAPSSTNSLVARNWNEATVVAIGAPTRPSCSRASSNASSSRSKPKPKASPAASPTASVVSWSILCTEMTLAKRSRTKSVNVSPAVRTRTLLTCHPDTRDKNHYCASDTQTVGC